VQERIMEKHTQKILKNPNLFANINSELDKKIVGEFATRRTILLVANGRNVENPSEKASFNLLVGGTSGIGKDYVTSNTLKILPKNEIITRRRITKKVFAYWHNAKFEPEFTWDKKVFSCEDISNAVLNEDVFKVMASSGNATSTVIINQKAVDIEINGKPCIIITIAEADPKVENLRRFPICDLDESINQTKAIMKRQSEFAKEGKSIEYDSWISKALGCLERIKVKIPYANKIAEHFPTEHHIMRTNYPRFLDYIKSSCAYYQFQREKDEDNYYLATGQDYDIAKECFAKTISSKNLIPITAKQKKILNVIRKEGFRKFRIAELIPKVPFIQERQLRRHLNTLTEIGFFEMSEEDTETSNRPVYYYEFRDQATFKIPEYDKIMSNDNMTNRNDKETKTNITTKTTKTIKTNTSNKEKELSKAELFSNFMKKKEKDKEK